MTRWRWPAVIGRALCSHHTDNPCDVAVAAADDDDDEYDDDGCRGACWLAAADSDTRQDRRSMSPTLTALSCGASAITGGPTADTHAVRWLIGLWFNVPLDTKQVISETFPRANLVEKTKLNTTKARINQSEEMNYNTK